MKSIRLSFYRKMKTEMEGIFITNITTINFIKMITLSNNKKLQYSPAYPKLNKNQHSPYILRQKISKKRCMHPIDDDGHNTKKRKLNNGSS